MASTEHAVLEIRPLSAELSPLVASFFHRLANSPTSDKFHPHPFTDEEALRRCNYAGLDLIMC